MLGTTDRSFSGPLILMTDLPTLEGIRGGQSRPDSPLALLLSTLFESSPILVSTLEPQLASALTALPALTSYHQLIDAALAVIARWELPSQANFIAGHPRIGESKNLSNLSAKEQGATTAVAPTPPEVLARLVHLNACYENKYPGLRYITFVNGRSRAAIAEEMEDKLGLEHSLLPDEPAVYTLKPVEVGGEAWKGELERAIRDIGYIAKNRLGAMGVK